MVPTKKTPLSSYNHQDTLVHLYPWMETDILTEYNVTVAESNHNNQRSNYNHPPNHGNLPILCTALHIGGEYVESAVVGYY